MTIEKITEIENEIVKALMDATRAGNGDSAKYFMDILKDLLELQYRGRCLYATQG